MRDGFIKVAAGTPEIRVADCAHNAQACAALLRQAQNKPAAFADFVALREKIHEVCGHTY